MSNFPIEIIPDDDNLFMNVHKTYFDEDEEYNLDEIPYNAFRIRDGDDGLSCDWDKYSSALETRMRAKIPEENGVITFNAGEIRNIKNFELTPLEKDLLLKRSSKSLQKMSSLLNYIEPEPTDKQRNKEPILFIEHNPISNNRAHSLLNGIPTMPFWKKDFIRIKIALHCNWKIRLGE